LELYGMPAGVAEIIASEYGTEPETFDDGSAVVVLEPAGYRGTCDTCQREAVVLYVVGPADEGSWEECEVCIRAAAARRSA
jgi:hypothetical protein